MSGLVANETRLDAGAIQVRLGEGRTAEVLRNLCHAVTGNGDQDPRWQQLTDRIRALFGVSLSTPQYIPERGELSRSFTDRHGTTLDISSAGRGMQQTMLLMAFLLTNPGSVLLLDEPDAHLEVLRQRQIYDALTEVARAMDSQIIAATHSEIILNEAAHRDVVVAFVGKPHRIDGRGSQVVKALKSIGFDHYYQAETAGWVLYLEGATDLSILQSFARTLNHPAATKLEKPFVHYIADDLPRAWEHFYGLREAKQDLVGFVLTDRLERESPTKSGLVMRQWKRREIENYLCFPAVLERYAVDLASSNSPGPLFEVGKRETFAKIMRDCVSRRVPPAALDNLEDPFWINVKASDDFLDLVFEDFFKRVNLPNLMRKNQYHRLAAFVFADEIEEEVVEVLTALNEVAEQARPHP